MKKIGFLCILCLRFEEDLITEAVNRQLEGRVGLAEVRSVSGVGDVWVKFIKQSIERELFR